jgi:lipopolysaccharide/colanic/teichoic acid biosynthesis glycosyltransferase
MLLNVETESERRAPSSVQAWPDLVPGETQWRWYLLFKRVLDFVLAFLTLLVSSPVLLVAAALVKLTSRGPVFYAQCRMGLGGRPFTIYKLRSMYHNCEKDSGVRWSTKGDPRVTPLGWFLRASHIDELPQLWNILRGDMSLVGPRPERPEFLPQLEKALPRYRRRLLVRPGLTGLAQVQLPPDTDMASVRRKLAHDLYYIERLSFWLDVRILFSTVLHVFRLPYSFTRLFVPRGETVVAAYRKNGDAKRLTAVDLAPQPQPV